MSNQANNPLISVIVPVYNVQDYLGKCLDSILCQTYQNLEILLVDDGSTDSSGKICETYATADHRIHFIHQPNKGLSAARNTGFSASLGEYILFVDSDDFIHPQMISLMLQELQQNNADLVCCRRKRVAPDFLLPDDTIQPGDYSIQIYNDYKAFHEIYTANYTTMIVVWNKLYPRKLISSLRFPEGRIHEDEFFSPRVLADTQNLVMIDYPLYFYVIRPDSIMNRALSEKSLDKLTALSENAAYFQSRNAADKCLCENIRLLDYCISFCVTFRTQNGKKHPAEQKIRKLFAETYQTMNRKSLSKTKQVKYALFYHMYPLFLWQEIHLRKILHPGKR